MRSVQCSLAPSTQTSKAHLWPFQNAPGCVSVR